MQSRPHISLDVTDLDASVHFYSVVFATKPTKQREDYANFRLEEPPLHLALVSQSEHLLGTSPNQHFGIELFADAQLQAWRERVELAGLVPRIEESVTCCYAVADKFWLQDPDGNEWEFWVRSAEADQMHGEEVACCTPEPQAQVPTKTARCEPTCCG